MKKVLTVLETGGAAPQEWVHGLVFENMFVQYGIDSVFVPRHPKMPMHLLTEDPRPSFKILRRLGFNTMWGRMIDPVCTRINEKKILDICSNFDAIHLITVSSLDLIQKIRKRSKARIVYNLADSLWLPAHANLFRHINDIMSEVDAVTCDNPFGLEYARKYNPNIFLWPPPSQVESFDLQRDHARLNRTDERIIIGWIGSPSTTFNLFSIWEALEEVFKKHTNVHLRLIGVGRDPSRLPQFEHVTYSTVPYYTQAEMIREVLNMDIGLFPMFDVEDSRVRGILKALIYMSGGAAVVASPRGHVKDLISHGVNGLISETKDEWIENIETLIQNEIQRKQLSIQSLATARTKYSMEKSFESLRRALNV